MKPLPYVESIDEDSQEEFKDATKRIMAYIVDGISNVKTAKRELNKYSHD